MKRLLTVAATVLFFAAPAAIARDSALHLSLDEAVAAGRAGGQLDGTVTFHLQGAKAPKVQQSFGAASVNRKTNAFNKSDEDACQWVTIGALEALQQAAKKRGANAVVDMQSNFKNKPWADPAKYECHAGGIMAGVAFKGTYARVGR